MELLCLNSFHLSTSKDLHSSPQLWTAWTPATNQSTRAIQGTGVVNDPFEFVSRRRWFIVKSNIGRLSLKHKCCFASVMCTNSRNFLNINISRDSICCIAQACVEVQQVLTSLQRISSRASSICSHPNPSSCGADTVTSNLRNIKFPGHARAQGGSRSLLYTNTTTYNHTRKNGKTHPKALKMPINSP